MRAFCKARRVWSFYGLVLLFLVVVSFLTYPGVLTGGVLLPVDWLYEAFYPWKAYQPSVVSINPRQSDAILQHYPLDLYTRERLRRLEAPLWNPYLGGGIPHLATGYTRAFYPPAWPGLLLSPEAARNYEILAHLTLAAFFQFLFLRRLGCGGPASFLGALAFGWSGALSLRTPLNYVFTLVWLPFMLYAVEGILRKIPGSVLVFALATGLQILAGFLPDVASSWFFLCLYLGGRLLGSRDEVGRGSTILKVGMGAALGASLAAIQLLPQWELVSLSHRGARSYQELAATGASFLSLGTLLSPRLFGTVADRDYWLATPAPGAQFYIGVVGLMMAVASLKARSSAPRGSLLLAGAGTFLLAAGTPVLFLAYKLLPPFAGLRYVHTFSNVCPVALSGLAGIGAHRLLSEGAFGSTPLKILVGLSLAGGVGAGVVSLAISGGKLANVLSETAIGLGIVAVVSGLLLFCRAGRISSGRLAAALILISILDLVRFPRSQNPVVSPKDYPIFPATPGLDLIAADEGLYRALAVIPETGGEYGPWVAPPNSLMPYRIPDAGAYHSLLPARLVRYYTVMERLSEGAPPLEALAYGRRLFNALESYDFRPSPLARLMNIRYVLFGPAESPSDRSALRRLYTGELRVFQYVEALPRAFVVHEFEVLPSPEAVLRRLVQGESDPRQTVLLEEAPSRPLRQTTLEPQGEAKVISYSPESIRIDVTTESEGFLVVCDTFFPGWRARVEGKPARLMSANYLFRAVPVSGGSSVVELRYEPVSFILGRSVSLCGIILWIALGIRWRWRGGGAARVAQALRFWKKKSR